MYDGGEYSTQGGKEEHPLKKLGSWMATFVGDREHAYTFIQTALLIVILTLIVMQFIWDQDLKEIKQKMWIIGGDGKAVEVKPASAFDNREGLIYQGASKDVLRSDLGWPTNDSLAEKWSKSNNATEMLVESGRDPNIYFAPVQELKPPATAEISTTPSGTGVATGFRDRMSNENEEELAKFIGK